MKFRLFIAVMAMLAVILPWTVKAQVDPHFSQYFIQPMALNPALTGAIEGDYRVSAIWRSQYGNTLSTLGLAGEVPTRKNMNLGINILHQYSADKSYSYTNGYLNAAYTGVRFGEHQIVMAMQLGLLNRRFDISKLQFGEQWTAGVGYDPSAGSTEMFRNSSVASFDAGAGIVYYDGTPDKKMHLFGGFAASHLTRPWDPFLSAGEKRRLPVRYSAHAGARILLSKMAAFVPNLLYMRQGNAEEKMLGGYLQLYVNKDTDVMFGANVRLKDAVSPFAGLYYKGLTVGVSYDVNALDDRVNPSGRNSLEVSLSFVGWNGNTEVKAKPFYCPRF
jgi:type IX secretion system PorP/SprF family membrane protein